MPRCDKCEARTVWVQIEASGAKPPRKIPLDANPGDGPATPMPVTGRQANVLLTGVRLDDGTPVARHVSPGAGQHSCHWATCPERQASGAGRVRTVTGATIVSTTADGQPHLRDVEATEVDR